MHKRREKGEISLITLLLIGGCLTFIFKGPGIIDKIPFFHKKKPVVPEKSSLLQEHERQAAQFVHDYIVLIEQSDVEIPGVSRRHKTIAKEIAYRVVITAGGAPIQKIDVMDLDSAEKLKSRLEKEQMQFNDDIQKWVREVKKLEAEKNALGLVMESLWNYLLGLICICIAMAVFFPTAFGFVIKRLKGTCKQLVDSVEESVDDASYEKWKSKASQLLDNGEKTMIRKFENRTILY